VGSAPSLQSITAVDRIETRMELEGDLTDEQYTRLLEISEKCPIKKTLASEIVIVPK
jgi:putative redox protein